MYFKHLTFGVDQHMVQNSQMDYIISFLFWKAFGGHIKAKVPKPPNVVISKGKYPVHL